MLYSCRRMSFYMSLAFFLLLSLSRSLCRFCSYFLSQRTTSGWQLLCNVFFRLLSAVSAYLPLILHRTVSRPTYGKISVNFLGLLACTQTYIHRNDSMQTSKAIASRLFSFFFRRYSKWKNKKKHNSVFLSVFFLLLFFFYYDHKEMKNVYYYSFSSHILVGIRFC